VVVGPASRIEEALELARDAAFDVAVLDVNLAGVQTYPVAAKVKARGIPFIFATGYGAAEFPNDLAGTPTLEKPFRQDGLKDAIAHAVLSKLKA
jgi:CheY-like chemotaxis protein